MAESKNTGFKRATTATLVGFSGDILTSGETTSTSPTVSSTLVLSDFNYTVPNGATIEGIEVQSKVLNEGSGSIPEFGDLVVRAQVGYSDGYGTNNDVTLSNNTSTNLNFGSSTSLQGKTWTSALANNLQLKFTYVSDNSGFVDTQTLAVLGSSTSLLPAVKIHYSHTPDISYTRGQLRNRITSSQIFDSNDNVQFELNNNASSTTYFTIEGVNGKNIFDIATISNLNNCTVVSESKNAGFIIEPGVTATFNFLPSTDIQKNEIQFIATNALVYNINDTTASGSVFGVDLGISSVI